MPRDTPPATTLTAKPESQHAAMIPQCSARPAIGNQWEIATSGAAEKPSTLPNTHQPAQKRPNALR